uniref:Uncharacterized protein n=1 Tax=Anguilla anguilla TaxID=7936 RepID=A0A0E9V539_ANGAN
MTLTRLIYKYLLYPAKCCPWVRFMNEYQGTSVKALFEMYMLQCFQMLPYF